MMRLIAAMLCWGALALASPVSAQDGSRPNGTYSVHGSNIDGSKYTGTVVIKPEGKRFRFSWLIANGDTFHGVGSRHGNKIVVDWGQKYPVIYDVADDGVLYGKWDNGKGSETLVPNQ